MKRGAKVGILFVGGAALFAAMSRGRSGGSILAYPVTMPGGGTTQAAPSPPTQGNEFRMGAQPDPSAPNDSNRGRTFLIMEQSRKRGSVAQGSVPLLDLPMSANGRVELTMWVTRVGKPQRCSRWNGSANVANGRISYPGSWTVPKPAICGLEHAVATDSGGCTVKQVQVQWEQQGPTIALTWRTEVTNYADCDETLQFYVDAFWRWIE